MTTSLVVPTWNGGDEFLADLRALVERAAHEVDEIVVVDNGSDDGTPERVADGDYGVRLVCEPVNRGYASAVNRGLREARGDVFLILNPDALPDAGALAVWAEATRLHPEYFLLGGVVADLEGRIDPFAARRRPRIGDILSEGLFLRRPHRLDSARVREPGGTILDVGVVSGAAMGLRRDAFERIGPLDEEYFLYHEDVEWCDRARARGGRVGLVPGVLIRHRQGTTTRRDERAPFAARMLSDFQYFVEARGHDARDVAWRWRVRTLFRAWLYGADARFGVLGRRAGSRMRSRIYRGLFDALGELRWAPDPDGQNGHPDRVLPWVQRRVSAP